LRTESHYFKFATLLSQQKVSVDSNGILTVDSILAPNGQARRWREIGGYVWREVDGQATLAAKYDAQHRLQYFANDYDQPLVYQPAPWPVNSAWNLPLFAVSLAVVACHSLLWPVAAIMRRRWSRPLSPPEKSMSLTLHLTSIGFLLFFGIWGWLFASFVELIAYFNAGIDPWLRVLQFLGIACVVGATASTVKLLAHPQPAANRWKRIASAGALLAYADLIWVAVVFRLLWPSLR
jgi:hypothetical protein